MISNKNREIEREEKVEKIKISTDFIKLDQFLKWAGVCESGVIAKNFILDEMVKVNGMIEIRRGKKLYPGDKIEVMEKSFLIE